MDSDRGEETKPLIDKKLDDIEVYKSNMNEGGKSESKEKPKLESLNYAYLNGLRGIGAMSVYFYHFYNFYP